MSSPWDVGMRNILVHQYFRIDLDPVWLAATDELQSLRFALEKILDRAGERQLDS